MHTIEKLAHECADGLSHGRFEIFTRLIDVPTSVYLGEKLVYIADTKMLLSVLVQYRENLCKLGYVRTIFQNLETSIAGTSSVRVLFDWVNVDEHGETMSVANMCVYVSRKDTPNWRVTLVSAGALPKAEVLEGLAIY